MSLFMYIVSQKKILDISAVKWASVARFTIFGTNVAHDYAIKRSFIFPPHRNRVSGETDEHTNRIFTVMKILLYDRGCLISSILNWPILCRVSINLVDWRLIFVLICNCQDLRISGVHSYKVENSRSAVWLCCMHDERVHSPADRNNGICDMFDNCWLLFRHCTKISHWLC